MLYVKADLYSEKENDVSWETDPAEPTVHALQNIYNIKRTQRLIMRRDGIYNIICIYILSF